MGQLKARQHAGKGGVGGCRRVERGGRRGGEAAVAAEWCVFVLVLGFRDSVRGEQRLSWRGRARERKGPGRQGLVHVSPQRSCSGG